MLRSAKKSVQPNHALSDRKLIRAMRHDRPTRFLSLLSVIFPVLQRLTTAKKFLSGIPGVGVAVSIELVLLQGFRRRPILENMIPLHFAPRRFPSFTGKGPASPSMSPHPSRGERYAWSTLKIVSSDPDKACPSRFDALKAAFPPQTSRHSSPLNKFARPSRPRQNLR